MDINSPYIQVDDKLCEQCVAPNRYSIQKSSSFTFERTLHKDGGEGKLGQENVMFGPEKMLRVTNQTIVVMKNSHTTNYKGYDGILVVVT